MARTTLTLNNAPAAERKAAEDTVDITESLRALEAASLLEAEVAKDDETNHAGVAAGKLAEFRLSHLARALLDKAVINVAANTGRGLTDPKAVEQAQLLAAVVRANGDDLPATIDCLVAAVDTLSAPGMIYKLCYATQKALNFIGNMAYRRALDPAADFDLEKFVDYREEEREPPAGLEHSSEIDELRAADHEIRGKDDSRPDHELIFTALEDVHIYLQLLTEAFGWDPSQPLPYMVVMSKEETFSPVLDLEHCLDLMELRYKEARAKRQEAQLDSLRKALAHSQAMLKKAGAKR